MRAPRPTYRYTLRRNALVPMVDAVCAWIARHASALAMAAVFAVWIAAQDSDYHEQVAQANQQRDQAQQWAAGNKVRVTLEGDAGQVANLAAQVSNAVRP